MGTIMILERAELNAKPGTIEAFVSVLRSKGVPLLEKIPGCLGARVGGGVENPDKLLLLVDWESLEAHDAFKKMPEYAELGKMLGPYAAGGGAEHFKMK
jgi:heme-degrading monooxygenase HmoA